MAPILVHHLLQQLDLPYLHHLLFQGTNSCQLQEMHLFLLLLWPWQLWKMPLLLLQEAILFSSPMIHQGRLLEMLHAF